MPSIRVYKGAHLNRANGTKRDFYIDHAGMLYDNGLDEGLRKVGKMNGRGEIKPSKKCLARYAPRLKQIANSKGADTWQVK